MLDEELDTMIDNFMSSIDASEASTVGDDTEEKEKKNKRPNFFLVVSKGMDGESAKKQFEGFIERQPENFRTAFNTGHMSVIATDIPTFLVSSFVFVDQMITDNFNQATGATYSEAFNQALSNFLQKLAVTVMEFSNVPKHGDALPFDFELDEKHKFKLVLMVINELASRDYCLTVMERGKFEQAVQESNS